MSELIKEVGASSFEKEVLQSSQPILVDFWAAWCGPCRMLAPILETVAGQYRDTVRAVKLNVDEHPDIAERYAIRSIPTMILFKDGKEEERVIGLTSKESLGRLLDKHVSALRA